MTDRRAVLSRRAFLRASGLACAAGLAGCTLPAGSIDPSMDAVMGVEDLSMFKGAPATGDYPASPSHIEMEMPGGMHMEMETVTVEMTAAADDSNNYHFMPHVTWVEPGQMVFWRHFAQPGVSEPRTHTVTSFGAAGRFMRLIPDGAAHFDSGYRAGTHSTGSPAIDREELIDERFNRGMVARIGQEGGFSHTFEQQGVYLFYCQNHHEFKMAGAVVVGELWGEEGTASVADASGWAPAMTANLARVPRLDRIHGRAVQDQLHEVREMIISGGEFMGHGMEMTDGGMSMGADEGGHDE